MKIILASGSWLRKKILESSELDFQVIVPEIDERAIESEVTHLSDVELAIHLSSQKAAALAAIHKNAVIIAADSFAVLPDGSRLHKPTSLEEAIALSMAQSGKTITAVTGMTMQYGDTVIESNSETKITYVDFDEQVIRKLFIANDFSIRNSGLGFFIDAPGFTLVKQFEGSYTGAMGLPMEHVRNNLMKFGYYNK